MDVKTLHYKPIDGDFSDLSISEIEAHLSQIRDFIKRFKFEIDIAETDLVGLKEELDKRKEKSRKEEDSKIKE